MPWVKRTGDESLERLTENYLGLKSKMAPVDTRRIPGPESSQPVIDPRKNDTDDPLVIEVVKCLCCVVFDCKLVFRSAKMAPESMADIVMV